MKRRSLMQLGMVGGLAALTPPESLAVGRTRRTLTEATVAELQLAMQAGEWTSVQLVQMYTARIRAIDRAGPRLNAVIELNPDAASIAKVLDQERRRKGPRGPLHGIPVLLKDNIATADGMQTTAGSLALVGVKPIRDAHLVRRLRDAGAVILGKTNLSEWANMRSTRSTSGWSARGGLTKNPYALDRNTSGSSSGAGCAMAAGLAALAVGTETDGSITSPASINGVVGIKPTVGLVSRAGIIPISHSQDTAGPMTRTVADAAALLSAMVGTDADDPATVLADQKLADYTRALNKDGLRGKRIGVLTSQFEASGEWVKKAVGNELTVLKDQGAVLIDIAEIPNATQYGESELTVLLYELKHGLTDYFSKYAPGAAVQTLADLIAFNDANRGREMAHFGQEHFIRAQAMGGLDSAEYREALANNLRLSREEGLDKVFAQNQLDALVAPTCGLAWLTDLINGDSYGASFTSPAAVAGYPHITVPAGLVRGLPCGLSFVGLAWSEADLIGMAYAYEQASQRRRSPTFKVSL